MINGQCTRPLLPITLCVLGGIVMGSRYPGHCQKGLLIAGGLLIGLLLWFGWGVVQKRSLRASIPTIGLVILFLVTGYCLIQPWRALPPGHRHVLRWVDGPEVWVRGTVSGPVKKDPYGTRFDLVDIQIRDQERWLTIRGGIRARIRGAPALGTHDRVELQGKLKPVHSMRNPGGFNYERYLGDRNLFARMGLKNAASLEILSPVSGIHLNSILDSYRHTIHGLIEEHIDPRAGGVLRALVTGDRGKISPELMMGFRHAGVAHLLAISGLHIGIVGALVFGIWRWVLGRLGFFLARGWSNKTAAFLSLGPIWLYGLLSGMAPSTLRAVIMVSAVLVALMLGKRPDGMNTLAAAALTIMSIHPPALYSVSFQLSFGAVFWLLVGLKTDTPADNPPETIPNSQRSRLKQYFWIALRWGLGLLRVSTLAWLGTLPLVLYYFNTVVWIGVPVNLIVVPLVSLWVVPLALLGALFAGWWPALAILLFKISAGGLTMALNGVTAAAALPFAWNYTFTPTIFEIVLYYCFLYLAVQHKDLLQRANGYVSGVFWTRITIVSLVLAVLMDSGYWCYQRWWRNDLRVTLLDVGQGTAGVVVFPGGRVWLVDGGGFSDNKLFDVGHRIVAPYLWGQKICRVNQVVLSHPNSDHYNGLLFILSHFNVGTFWSNGQTVDAQGYRELKRLLAIKKITAPAFSQIPRETNQMGVTIEVLYPEEQDLAVTTGRGLNRNSMILRIAHRNNSILFTGDVTRVGEFRVIERHGSHLKSDLLVVPHHGSKTSSSIAFIRAVQPSHALISCGWRNWFGFPHKKVLRRHLQENAQIWRTDQHGAISAFETSRGWRVIATSPDG